MEARSFRTMGVQGKDLEFSSGNKGQMLEGLKQLHDTTQSAC